MSDLSCLGFCTICHGQTNAIEWHHTVPQALGGVDSLQIPLCSDCHSTLHKKALAVHSRITGKSKKAVNRFWNCPNVEKNADQFVEIIVTAMLNPPDSTTKTYKMVVEVDANMHNGLKLLKQDTPAITNLQTAIRLCIKQTLQNKGLYYEQSPENSSSNPGNKGKNSLWNMQRFE